MFGMKLGGGTDPAAKLLLDRAGSARHEREKRIGEAWKRYEGEHPSPLKRSQADKDGKDNTTVNLARKTVDIGAFYTFGKALDVEVLKGETEAEEADTWLEEAWKANRQGTFLLEMAIAGGVTGHTFIRVYPAVGLEQYPRLVALDCQSVSVDWDPVDICRVNRYTISFNHVDLDSKAVSNHRHRISRDGTGWLIEEQISYGGTTWSTTSSERWPFTFAPVFHCKNLPAPHCFYGRSDIEEDVLRLNDAISFVISNVNRILKVHGHPQLAITGVSSRDTIDRAIDNVLKLPKPESKILTTPYVEDLSAHFEQLQKLRDAYHELTSVPEIATGKLENVGQLSGLALQILYGPLVQLVEVKRLFYGEMLEELCLALLAIGKKGTGLTVKIQWPQVLPIDRKVEAETAVELQAAGVSKSTTLKEMGYEPDDEAEARKGEAQEAADNFNAGNTGGGNPYGGSGGPGGAGGSQGMTGEGGADE